MSVKLEQLLDEFNSAIEEGQKLLDSMSYSRIMIQNL